MKKLLKTDKNKDWIQVGFILMATLFMISCDVKPQKEDTTEIRVEGSMEAELTSPPHVPAPVGDRGAMRVKVELEIIEEVGTMVDGTEYLYWTFGGTVPGSFIRTRVGDKVEFHLQNHPNNKLPHNIDLHAVTGPGGGAESSFVAPGKEIVFSFKTLNPGLYVYHCATAPVGMHIANGMYGLILVEPEGGLDPVDREYYIMQGDFYTEGSYGERGLQAFDMTKAIQENPDYVVFNGSVGALNNENALTAKVGETIRLFVGNGGPNLVSSFHAIGEIFDRVNVEGGTLVNENVQTTMIPAGGAAIVEFKVEVPQTVVLVDHSVFRAFNKGALGMLNVIGDDVDKIFTGTQMEGIYLPEGGAIQTLPGGKSGPDKQVVASNLEERIQFGQDVYKRTCAACHQIDGNGLASAFPPVRNSDYLNADINRAISTVLHGLSGEITVNGETFNSIMPGQNLTDDEIASVLTYITHEFDNEPVEVTPDMVKAERAKS